jgi:general stress protein 26
MTAQQQDSQPTRDTAKVAELVARAHLCTLTTSTPDGRLMSRPMALQDVEFDGDLWFFVHDDSDKVAQIAANPSVNVSFSNPKVTEWTSIAGTAELVEDRSRAEELWSPLLNAWFEQGLDTPTLALIKVHADSAEYWDGPSSRVVSLLGMARAAISRDSDKYPSYEHGEVDL